MSADFSLLEVHRDGGALIPREDDPEPGIAILVSVLAINLMGDGLRDALDPKLKRS